MPTELTGGDKKHKDNQPRQPFGSTGITQMNLIHHQSRVFSLFVSLISLALSSNGTAIASSKTLKKNGNSKTETVLECAVPSTFKQTCPLKKTVLKPVVKKSAVKKSESPPVKTIVYKHPPTQLQPKKPQNTYLTSMPKTEIQEKNIITIDQRHYNINQENAQTKIKAAQVATTTANRRAKAYYHKYRAYKRAYHLLKRKGEDQSSCGGACEKKQNCCEEGGEGFYLGLVIGMGPDGVVKRNEAEPEYELINQDYRPFVGGRLMGVSRSGFAGGVQVMSNRSISLDLNFKIK